MRIHFKFFLFIGLVCCFFSCKKDTYNPPSSSFTGKITYQGTPIYVKASTSSSNNVYFELWQYGFGKSGAITAVIGQDGSYSALLFNGTYKLVIPKAQGPFMSLTNTDTNSDTIPLVISGNKSMNIEVLPYYMLSNSAFTLGKDSTVSGTCKLQKIITNANAKDIDFVAIYVNRTAIVDDDNQIANASITGGSITDMNNIKLTTKIPTSITSIGSGTQSYFFARIGVKISGIEDMLFSPVQQIQF